MVFALCSLPVRGYGATNYRSAHTLGYARTDSEKHQELPLEIG